MRDEAPPGWIEAPPDWKLQLRDGRTKTPYEHFTVVAQVHVIEANADLGSQVGPAWMAANVWHSSADAAAELLIGALPQAGAEVRGECEVYKTEPDEPPQAMPYAYDIVFEAYEA